MCMCICQTSLLQIRFDIYSALNEKKPCILMWSDFAMSIAFDKTYYCSRRTPKGTYLVLEYSTYCEEDTA